MTKKINEIPLKEAESNQEKRLLGAIEELGRRVCYGRAGIEITFHDGKMVKIAIVESHTSLRLE